MLHGRQGLVYALLRLMKWCSVLYLVLDALIMIFSFVLQKLIFPCSVADAHFRLPAASLPALSASV